MGLVAAMIKGGTGILAARAQTRLAALAADHVRDGMVRRLLHFGLADPSPVAVARASSRVREIDLAVHDGVLATARAAAQLVPIAVALVLVSPSLSAIAATVLLPFALLLARARRAWRKHHEGYLLAADRLHEEMDDLIRHTDLWRTYGTGDHVRNTLDDLAARMIATRGHAETLRAVLSSSNEVLGALALVLALIAGARWSSQLGDGTIIAFAAVFFMAYRPLRDLGDARTFLARGQDALRAIAELSTDPHSTQTASAAAPAPSSAQSLLVQGLAVDGQTPCVSFEAPAGSLVVLVGATGAGKSTLLRALLGLEPRARGSIRLGERTLAPGRVGPSDRPFAWVPQDAPIVSGSLDDNFRLAGTTETDAEHELASLGAPFLRSALAGVKLGAAGRPLSGGERRWVAVARALATRMPVLLLDEPSVGLDATARQRLLDTLASLRGHRTMIVASHDDDVVAIADHVIRLEVSPRS